MKQSIILSLFIFMCTFLIDFVYADNTSTIVSITSDDESTYCKESSCHMPYEITVGIPWMEGAVLVQADTNEDSFSQPLETEEYKIYENERYGFTIEYPSYWTYEENMFETHEKAELIHLNSSLDTSITFTLIFDDLTYGNLDDQEYLEKMIEKQQDTCNKSNSFDDEFVCSNFRLELSDVILDSKYLTYVIGYTFTQELGDNTNVVVSDLIFQIPDQNNTWLVSMRSTPNDLPYHIKEMISILNSFTISEYKKPEHKTCESGIIKDGICTSVEEVAKKKDGGCLIATATYGSELAPQVQQLRELRDNSLLQTASGTSFMSTFNQFYYSFSPTIADWERENPAFKEFVKISLTPMISSLSILNYVDMDSEVSVLGYGISLILLNIGIYFVAPVVIIHQIKKKF